MKACLELFPLPLQIAHGDPHGAFITITRRHAQILMDDVTQLLSILHFQGFDAETAIEQYADIPIVVRRNRGADMLVGGPLSQQIYRSAVHLHCQAVAPEGGMDAYHLKIGHPGTFGLGQSKIHAQVPHRVHAVREIDIAKSDEPLPDKHPQDKTLGPQVLFHELPGKRRQQVRTTQIANDRPLQRHDPGQMCLVQMGHDIGVGPQATPCALFLYDTCFQYSFLHRFSFGGQRLAGHGPAYCCPWPATGGRSRRLGRDIFPSSSHPR